MIVVVRVVMGVGVVMVVCVPVRMLVAMDRSVRMHVLMRMPMCDFSVYARFILAAAAGRAHTLPLSDFDFLDAHLRAAGYPNLQGAALRAGAEDFAQGHAGLTMLAPAGSRRRDYLEPRAFGQAAARHRIEAKTHRLDLDPRELAYFQPDRGNPGKFLRPRRILD